MRELTAEPLLQNERARARFSLVQISFLVALVGLSACSSAPKPKPIPTKTPARAVPQPVPAMPRTLGETMTLANTLAPCAPDQEFAISTRPASASPDRPVFVDRCIPHYPDVLRLNGYVAACYTAFDIADDGATMGIVVKCNTENALGRDDPEELELAHSMTNRIIYRAMSKMRFTPPTADTPEKMRKNIVQPIRFSIPDYPGVPDYPPVLGEVLGTAEFDAAAENGEDLSDREGPELTLDLAPSDNEEQE